MVLTSRDMLVLALATRSNVEYVACWKPTARKTVLAREPRGKHVSAVVPGFAVSGPWVVIERRAGRSCNASRTIRSFNVVDERQGYVVATHTCHVGSSGEQDNRSMAFEGPWPPTVLDNGPAPGVRHGMILEIAIAANGDFAWTVTGSTYPGSFDAASFGPVASGLFVPAGGGHDTNLSILRLPKFFPLNMKENTLSWSQFGVPLTYSMPTPGASVLPVRIQGIPQYHPATPPGG